MRAAIYARRSTDEHQAASLDVQLDEARRYIARKGWTQDPEHVFVDDAISRAEFKKRPALIAMLVAAEAQAFDVVVVRDETRLGGDTNRTCLLIQDLLDADVRLFYYYSDEEVRLDNAVAKFLVTARNFASELEREKISQRTHEHLKSKARSGFVAGSRVFGYDHERVVSGGVPHVEYRINEREAEVVRTIFRLTADGMGLRMIARELNDRGLPSPRAGKRGTGSWSVGSIWGMLRNERYIGRLTWGRREKTYRKGTKVRIARAESEHTHVDAPQLRIVSQDLWDAVATLLAQRQHLQGPRGPRASRIPDNLLTGLARCAECGGPISSRNGKLGQGTVKYYHCKYHHDRGNKVCSNKTRRPAASVDAVVIRWLQESVLSERLIVDVVAEVKARLRAQSSDETSEVPGLEANAKRLRAEVGRLAAALAVSDTPPAAIVSLIGEKEGQLRAIDQRLAVLRAGPASITRQLDGIEAAARTRLGDLRGLLGRHPREGRQVLEQLLDGKIKVSAVETTDGPRYLLEGAAMLAPLLGVEGGTPPLFASSAGSEQQGTAKTPGESEGRMVVPLAEVA